MLAIHSSAAYPLQDNTSRTDLGRATSTAASSSTAAAAVAASVSRIHHFNLAQQQRSDRAEHHLHNHQHLLSSPSTALTMKEFFLHRRQHQLHTQQPSTPSSSVSPVHPPHQRSLSHPHQRTITTTTTTTTTTTASDLDLFSLHQHHRLHSFHLQQQRQQIEQLQQQHQQAYHHATLHSSPSSTATPDIARNSTPTAGATTAYAPPSTTVLRASSLPTVVAAHQLPAATATATASPFPLQQQQRTTQKSSRPFLLPNHKQRRHNNPNHLSLQTTLLSPKKTTQTASPPSSPTTTAAMTPTAKIEARMARMTSDDLAKEKIVVLLTGSFCPVHLQHTEILEAAKREIEASGNSVVLGGFLSPSHDSYVGAKLWQESLVLNSDQRIALCQAQTQASDWIDVDAWEANQDEFYDYYEVARRLERHLNALFQGALAFQIHQKQQVLQATHNLNNQLVQEDKRDGEEADSSSSMAMSPTIEIPPHHQQYIQHNQQQHNYALQQASRIRVVYLCGADFVVRTGARDLTSGMVVVDRPVDTPIKSSKSGKPQEPLTVKEQVYRKLEQHYGRDWCDPSNNNLWFLPSRSLHPSEDVSSTKVRRLLGKRESCDGLLHPAVMALLESWLRNSVPLTQQQQHKVEYW